MKFLINLVISIFLFCFVFANIAQTQGQERDLHKEEKLWQQLEKIAPKSVEKFKAATNALDQKNYPESTKLYKEVLAQVPNFEPALRRLGYSLIAAGQREEGLKMGKKALEINRSPDNLMGYAMDLTTSSDLNYQPTESELTEAFNLAKEALNSTLSG